MRRGIGETALIAIILAVAGGLVIGGVVTTIVIKGKGRVDLDACRANVLTASQTAQLIPVNKCFTKNAGNLEYSGKTATYQREVAGQVSKLMQECRYQFGEASHLPWRGDFFTRGEPICFTCSTFRLPEKAPNAVTTHSLRQWMEKNVLPGGQTYYDYIIESVPFKDPDYFIITDMKYRGGPDNVFQKGIISVATGPLAAVYLFLVRPDPGVKVKDISKQFEPDTEYAVIHFGWPQKGVSQVAEAINVLDLPPAQTIGVGEASEYSSVFIMPIDRLHTACALTFTRYP